MKKLLALALSGFLFGGALVQNAEAKNYYFKFNEKQSKIGFYFATTLHPVNGEVKKFKGFIDLTTDEKEENAVKTSGLLEITAESLFTNQNQRDSRMRSEILSIKSFPLITFKVKEAKITGNNVEEDGSLYMRLIGDLTIRDVTKPVQIPVKIKLNKNKDSASVEGKYTVNFKDYNVPDPSLPIIGKVEENINIDFKIKTY